MELQYSPLLVHLCKNLSSLISSSLTQAFS
jgi:hypothetical protein